MTQIPLFADVMALHPLADQPGCFEANLNAHWTIGPKPHGGVMIALCANAARAAYGDAHPIAVSANFLAAPDPGPVRLTAVIRKRGRRVGLVDVELSQGERVCVRAVVTVGDPEGDTAALYSDNPVLAAMTVEPPDDVMAIGPGHPAVDINNLAHGCDIRPMAVKAASEGAAPMFHTWVRPKAGRVDELFALMCGDISLPVTYAVGRAGWAPTVQLTAYLRAMPADGWLRVMCTATEIGDEWFDEDHIVVDSTGRIVVQSRQLALVPAR